MFKFLNSRVTKAVSAAVVIMNLGVGLASTSFAQVAPPSDPWGQQTPGDQSGVLTPQTLGALLQSMNLGVNTVNDNGQVEYELNIPGKNGAPAVTLLIEVSPNQKFINLIFVAGQFNQQSTPSQQELLAMLEANDKLCPAYIDIENNLVVLRDNVSNQNVTANQLMDELKFFYSAAQATQQVVAAPPADNQGNGNGPFN